MKSPPRHRPPRPGARKLLDEETVLALVEEIYSTLDEPGKWRGVLELLSNAVGCRSVGLHLLDLGGGGGSALHTVNFDPDFVRSYEAHYSRVNPRTIHGGHLLVPGKVVTSQEQYPDDLMAKTEFLNDWLAPQGLFHSAGVAVLKEGALTSNLTLFRGLPDGAFGEAEVALLKALAPHLQRAIQVQERLRSAEAARAGLAETLDHLPSGVFLVDDEGAVVFANRPAEEILGRRDGLLLDGGGLSALEARSRAALALLVRRAVVAGAGRLGDAGGALAVPRTGGRRPYSVLVCPLRSPGFQLGRRAALAVVFVGDPDREAATAGDQLVSRFGLSPSEVRLATALASGKDLRAISEENGITLNTARTHLKRIFVKTGIGRQKDLVRLVIKGDGEPAQAASPGSDA